MKDFRSDFYAKYVTAHQGSVGAHGNLANLAETIIPLVPKNREVRILDCGCGQGELLSLLNRNGFTNVCGIDVSQEQVESAVSAGLDNVFNEDVFDHVKDHVGTYDVIIAVDFAEHFERSEVRRLFNTLHQMLKPGGRLIIRTPNGSSPFSGRYLYSDLTHGIIYTNRSIAQVCNSVGFASVSVFPARPGGSGLLRSLRKCLWLGCELLIKIPLVIETGQVRRHIVTQNLIAVAHKANV